MTWRNLAAVVTTKQWQYTQPVTGNVIRIRHLINGGIGNAPYGFKGAIALAYNYGNLIELSQYRSIYPSTQTFIYSFDNFFSNREARIAIRGQRKYYSAPNWIVYVDSWMSTERPKLEDIDLKLSAISSNIALIASNLDVDPHELKNAYIIRINIGGGDYTDINGDRWIGRELPIYEGNYRTHNPIADPDSYLFESSLNALEAGYIDSNAPDGRYQISFYAQEWYRNDPTTRFIDIYINEVLVEEGLNIWTEAGGQYKPLIKTYTVEIEGGLRVRAVGQNDKPIIICALAIIQIA
ncbi:malectin domain-containing carbohydrate-binding protein [Myxosarcina sp. GI1]|uniref:malectin domain-containing carbohydrate-binding protein n=1 Tax=Myxosarcina sp. GI1 TaxID=1541065 RepID=UPI000559E380|nr:malectin domain-containing carbohydrate-binding protein [Myxosarcina sp. GI1]